MKKKLGKIKNKKIKLKEKYAFIAKKLSFYDAHFKTVSHEELILFLRHTF